MTAGSTRRAVGDDAFGAWMTSVESRLADLARVTSRPRVFANVTARNTAFPHPKVGDTCMVGTAWHLHDGIGWLVWETTETAFTPTITGSTSGTLAVGTGGSAEYWGRSQRMGSLMRYRGNLYFGTSGQTFPAGLWKWAYPTGAHPLNTSQVQRWAGAWCYHNSPATRQSAMLTYYQGVAADTFYCEGDLAAVGDVSPWTWAANDQLAWDFVYPMDGSARYL